MKVTSDPLLTKNMPPELLLNVRSEVSTAPVLLLIFTFVFPEIVIAEVKVMSFFTLMSAFVAIALDSAENVVTSVVRRRLDPLSGPLSDTL